MAVAQPCRCKEYLRQRRRRLAWRLRRPPAWTRMHQNKDGRQVTRKRKPARQERRAESRLKDNPGVSDSKKLPRSGSENLHVQRDVRILAAWARGSASDSKSGCKVPEGKGWALWAHPAKACTSGETHRVPPHGHEGVPRTQRGCLEVPQGTFGNHRRYRRVHPVKACLSGETQEDAQSPAT